jgi:hypothetical protein
MKKIILLIRLINVLSNYTFNFNDLFDLNIKEDDGEIRRNSFFVKFIISLGLIIWFNMDKEQVCCVIISNILSELIENLSYHKEITEFETKSETESESESESEIESIKDNQLKKDSEI